MKTVNVQTATGAAMEIRSSDEKRMELDIDSHSGIAIIRNVTGALSVDKVQQLDQFVHSAEYDPHVHKIILLLDKVHGANIKEFPYYDEDPKNWIKPEDIANAWQTLIRRMVKSQKPIIAAISGHVLGGGCEIALACDFTIAEVGAKIGQPEIKLGLMPGGGGTQTLARHMGTPKTLRMVLRGKTIVAKQPWVDCVTDDRLESMALATANAKVSKRKREPMRRTLSVMADESFEFNQAFVRHWKGCIPKSFELAHNAIVYGNTKPLDDGLKDERDAFIRAFETEDAREGITAFKEKREPKFNGK